MLLCNNEHRAQNHAPQDSRQQTADSRQQTADSRQQTADSRQQTADSRQQTADSRQQTADSRQQSLAYKSLPLFFYTLLYNTLAHALRKVYGASVYGSFSPINTIIIYITSFLYVVAKQFLHIPLIFTLCSHHTHTTHIPSPSNNIILYLNKKHTQYTKELCYETFS